MLVKLKTVFTAGRIRAFVGELFGTAILVMVVAMATLRVENPASGGLQPANPFLYTFSAMAIGLTLALMVYAFRSVASAHFNPAVTVAMFTLGRVTFKRSLLNILAQFFGAILAVLLTKLIFASQAFVSPDPASYLQNVEGLGLTANSIVVLEALAAFVFVLVVVAVSGAKQLTNFAPVMIGLALTLSVLLVQEYTGGVLNPAIALATNMPVIYFVAPILGAIMAAILSYTMHYELVLPLKLVAKNGKARKSK